MCPGKLSSFCTTGGIRRVTNCFHLVPVNTNISFVMFGYHEGHMQSFMSLCTLIVIMESYFNLYDDLYFVKIVFV
jgi:hypothetical protein